MSNTELASERFAPRDPKAKRARPRRPPTRAAAVPSVVPELLASERHAPPPARDPRQAIAERLASVWHKHVSPPGKLGVLPPLLESRRLEHMIPDAAFKQAMLFDKILLWQVANNDGQHYAGTQILMPETGKKREDESAPRGVIVAAGLKALDTLHSHGSGLGHIVSFIRLSPWRLPITVIEGQEINAIPLRVGDLIGDEDAGAALLAGELTVVRATHKDAQGGEYERHDYVGRGLSETPAMRKDTV